MGRVKLEIKKIETAVGKQVTYSKRRAGIEKKAKELATLCDIDLVLILFSPAGKLSWINGSKSPPEEVIMRFASLSPQERAKRKCEALEQLKRVFKKLDHDVNVEEYTRTPDQTIDELNQHLECLRLQFQHLQSRLQNYECYQTIDEAMRMENKLHRRLEEVRLQKQMLQTASQCLIPYDQQALEQQILPGDLLPAPIQLDHSSSSWDSDSHKQHSAHSLENDSSPIFYQRDMPRQFIHNSLVECNNQLQAGVTCDNLFGGVKNIHDLELKRESIGLERETNCSSAVDYMSSNGGRENLASPSGGIGNSNGIPVHWMTNTLADNMMSTQQATPQYLQHLNIIGNGSLPRNDIFGPDQNNSSWY